MLHYTAQKRNSLRDGISSRISVFKSSLESSKESYKQTPLQEKKNILFALQILPKKPKQNPN